LREIAIHPTLFYAPEQWVPHITLAYNDVTTANLDCVMRYLAFQSFNWEIQIDNLILVAQAEDQFSETVKYRLGN
jgi:2'-5' RNA ligase